MACREFVHTIFIGCWVLSGISKISCMVPDQMLKLLVLIVLFFVIALGIMAFIPRPVESLQGIEEVNPPLTPASFKAGSPADEVRNSSFYSIDSRTGFATYNNCGKSPDCTPSPENSALGEVITIGPPRLWWHGFDSPNLRHSNDTYGGTISMRNAPTEHTSVISGPRRVDPFHHSPLGHPSPPPGPIHSRASKIRPGAGGKNSSIAENRLNQSPAFPGLKRDALSPTSPHGSPPHVATPRDLATEYTPNLYSISGHHSVPASPRDHSQRERTHPDRARTATPSIHSFHSSAASVHPVWVESTPRIPPIPVLTSDTARFQGSSSFLGRENSSPGNNASFATRGSNAPPTPKLSEPHRTVQHSGALWAHQPYHPPVNESSFSRRDNDGQVLDQTQWRRLVLDAAAKP